MALTPWRPPVTPPVGAAEIDWSHPLSAGLGTYSLPGVGSVLDLLTNQVWTTSEGAPTPRVTIGGAGRFYGSADAETTPNRFSVVSQPFTLMTRCVPTDVGAGTRRTICMLANGTSAGNSAALINTNRATGVFSYYTDSFGDFNGTVPITAGTVHTAAITWSTSWTTYVNGAVDATVAATNGFGTRNLLVIGYNAAFGGGMNGTILSVAGWSRALSHNEAAWLATEPYAFLRPIVRRRYFLPTAGANTGTAAITLGALTSVATGVLTITGAATPTLGALTTTAAGLLAITGQAGVTLGGLTTTATGALPVAGVAAITLEELALGATGTLAIAGEAAITLGALTAHGFDAPPAISAGRQGHSAHRFIRGRGRPH